ncbi:MAG: 2,3,4,5-tetrahydropyridine-2,6-dicarboxylate N-succinyltransferase, partial [Candidatus Competibacter sp.]
MNKVQRIIEDAFERRSEIDAATALAELREAVEEALGLLELGRARVAERRDGTWVVNTWLKKAVLLSFRLNDSTIIRDGYTNYFDKVPPKYAEYGENDFLAAGVRVVPPAAARRGSYIAPGVVLMPSY